jgi:hypothetical protein
VRASYSKIASRLKAVTYTCSLAPNTMPAGESRPPVSSNGVPGSSKMKSPRNAPVRASKRFTESVSSLQTYKAPSGPMAAPSTPFRPLAASGAISAPVAASKRVTLSDV